MSSCHLPWYLPDALTILQLPPDSRTTTLQPMRERTNWLRVTPRRADSDVRAAAVVVGSVPPIDRHCSMRVKRGEVVGAGEAGVVALLRVIEAYVRGPTMFEGPSPGWAVLYRLTVAAVVLP